MLKSAVRRGIGCGQLHADCCPHGPVHSLQGSFTPAGVQEPALLAWTLFRDAGTASHNETGSAAGPSRVRKRR